MGVPFFVWELGGKEKLIFAMLTKREVIWMSKDEEMKKGRPCRYYTKVEPKLDLVEGWARDGLSMEQIAENLGISKTTFYSYAKKFSELSERIKKGREISDYQVENELFRKAVGFTRTEKRPVKLKEVEYSNGKRVRETERIEMVEQEVYYPSELGAQVFWLKNRRPDKWRDKVDAKIETEGQGSGVMILTPVKEEEDG